MTNVKKPYNGYMAENLQKKTFYVDGNILMISKGTVNENRM